jgi:hypothetical protein
MTPKILKGPICLFACHVLSLFAYKSFGQNNLMPTHDTTFYESFQQDIIGRMYLSQKYTSLEIKKGNNAPRLRYKPNTNLNLGIGAF